MATKSRQSIHSIVWGWKDNFVLKFKEKLSKLRFSLWKLSAKILLKILFLQSQNGKAMLQHENREYISTSLKAADV